MDCLSGYTRCTDSHTTMINGLGVLGWGVGGIEAEAAMLGQPVSMLIPDVVGFKLTGKLREGITGHRPGSHGYPNAAQTWRGGEIRRIYGDGLDSLPFGGSRHHCQYVARIWCHLWLLPNRCCNPRLHAFKRAQRRSGRVGRKYAKAQGMWRNPGDEPIFTSTLELDMNDVEASLAGLNAHRIALHCPMYQKHLPPVTNWM